MEWLVLLLAVVIIIAAVAWKLLAGDGKEISYPYVKSEVLFSPAERSFLGILDQAVGDEYRVFGKVRVADAVSVKKMRDRGAWQRAFNRISSKHFDFLLCSKTDLAVVAAIELDDQSHQQGKRKVRDAFVVGLCDAIALPLVQVPVQRVYSLPEVRAKVMSTLGVRQKPVIEPFGGTTDRVEGEPQPEDASAASASEPAPVTDPLTCPKCSSPMVRRRVKSGANAGQEFWGCSTYPKCRGIVPIHCDE